MKTLCFTQCGKRDYILSPTHYPCGIARTSEWCVYIFTMKMESLLEPTSNKLLVGGMWDLSYRSTMWQLNRNNGAIQSLESILVQVMDWRIPLKNRSLCLKTLFFSTSTVYSFFKPKGIFMIDNWFSIKPSLYCKNNFYWAIHDCFSNLFSSISGLKIRWFTHSVLSSLRCSGLRTARTAAKPCQGNSSELYLITGSTCTDQRGTVGRVPQFNESDQRHFRALYC